MSNEISPSPNNTKNILNKSLGISTQTMNYSITYIYNLIICIYMAILVHISNDPWTSLRVQGLGQTGKKGEGKTNTPLVSSVFSPIMNHRCWCSHVAGGVISSHLEDPHYSHSGILWSCWRIYPKHAYIKRNPRESNCWKMHHICFVKHPNFLAPIL